MSDYATFSRAESSIGPMLVVSGEIDMVTAPKFRSHLHAVIGDASASAFLDLSSVRYFDSTGVSVLVHAQDIAEAQGVDLVVDPSECVRVILELVALGGRFHWATPPEVAATEARRSA